MRWLLIGYMYLFIHRPFEIWPTLGTFRVELIYALFVGGVWLMHPGKRWLPNPLHRAFLAFAVATLICWVASPWASAGFDHIYIYFTVLYFYVLLTTSIRDEQDLRLVLQAFLIIMAIYMLHALYEFKCGRYISRMGIPRLIGMDSSMGDPNAFGATLLYALILVPASWIGNPSGRWRAFLVCYAILTVGCIGLTGSRGSFAALVLWVTISIALTRWRWAFGLAGLVAAPMLWAALPPNLQNRFETIINPQVGPRSAQVSAEGRLVGLQMGLQMFGNNPLTGCGPGVWRKATNSKLESHNLYGQLLGEMGLVGAIPFVCLVVVFWLNARRVARLYREHPHWDRDFLFHLGRGLGLTLFFLLLLGAIGHNLFRYTWVWYGALLIITRHCVERRALAEQPSAISYQPSARQACLV